MKITKGWSLKNKIWWIRLQQQSKCIETIELCKDEQLKQMDIWENKVAMVLFVGKQLEIGAYDVVNIDRVKN